VSNIKMALEAIRSARWRSLFTMLGIIIGVVSVVTTISLGEGTKHQIVGQINQAGPDLITVRPGRRVSPTTLLGSVGAGSLNEADLKTVQAVPGVKEAVPFSYISGMPSTEGRDYADALVIATNEGAPGMLNQTLAFGGFFQGAESHKDVAIIGKRVAEELFQENVPIGKLFHIRDKQFVVVGIFDEFDTSPLAPTADYNKVVFIPYESGQKLTGNQPAIFQILARPNDPEAFDQVAKNIGDGLAAAHAGQTDFSVLTQTDNLELANDVLNMLTGLVAAIASVSLIVGGIGILNIMFVSVTERTREIGVRKAVGATNRQIMGQFLTEATILSLTGGVIGILLSLLVNYLLRILTDLTPVLTWPVMLLAVGVSATVGVIFGITPALKAARKHPIDALRHE
jgi:putative ABC transport system permease protein